MARAFLAAGKGSTIAARVPDLYMGGDWMPPIRFIRNGIAYGAIVGPWSPFLLAR